MSDSMRIDPDAVADAAARAMEVAEEFEAAALDLGAATSDAMEPIAIGGFDCRIGMNTARAWWYSRVHQHRLRIDDLAEFMATNASNAASYDAEDSSDIVEIESELDDMSEYSTSDYYAAAGAEQSTFNPDAMPTADGDAIR
jgi:hypothetical protein